MRRIAAALLVPLAACAVLAGCGGSASGNANRAVSVTGSFGKVPNVTIPTETASSNLVIQTPIKGSGAALKSGTLVTNNSISLPAEDGDSYTEVGRCRPVSLTPY